MQEIIAGIIVLVAAAYLGRKAWKMFKGKAAGGCASCGIAKSMQNQQKENKNV